MILALINGTILDFLSRIKRHSTLNFNTYYFKLYYKTVFIHLVSPIYIVPRKEYIVFVVGGGGGVFVVVKVIEINSFEQQLICM